MKVLVNNAVTFRSSFAPVPGPTLHASRMPVELKGGEREPLLTRSGTMYQTEEIKQLIFTGWGTMHFATGFH